MGFVLADCCKRHQFISHEPAIGDIALRALRGRLTLSAYGLRSDPAKIGKLSIVV